MSRDVQITFDCLHPPTLAAFWAEVLGYEVQPPPPPFGSWDEALAAWGVPEDQRESRSALVDPDGTRPRLFFQRVPEPKAVKNRVHLDVRVGEGLVGEERMTVLEAERRRLEELGATFAYRLEPDPGGIETGFITMLDPEGHEFCLD